MYNIRVHVVSADIFGLYIRYNTDANVVYYLKTSSSHKLTGEKGLEIDEVYAEKIKVKFL